MPQDQRYQLITSFVDRVTGQPLNTIERGCCVTEPHPAEKGSYHILDGGTLNRVLRSMAIRGD